MILAAVLWAISMSAPAAELRVLTLNIKNDAEGGRVPGLVSLIRNSGADVAGLQEVDAAGPEIAARLGWNYARQDGDTAVVSRHELEAAGESAVHVEVLGAGAVTLGNLHLPHAPYQPFQLLGIPYEGGRFLGSAAEAIEAALAARGEKVSSALKSLLAAAAKAKSRGVIAVGDFNEPSFLDWTERAVAAGRHPMQVAWPSSKAFADAGFRDAYRRLHPDEVAKPGFTWRAGLEPADPKDHADRLDLVLYKGRALRPVSVVVLGESAETADRVVAPYPTDHRGVLVNFAVGRSRKR